MDISTPKCEGAEIAHTLARLFNGKRLQLVKSSPPIQSVAEVINHCCKVISKIDKNQKRKAQRTATIKIIAKISQVKTPPKKTYNWQEECILCPECKITMSNKHFGMHWQECMGERRRSARLAEKHMLAKESKMCVYNKLIQSAKHGKRPLKRRLMLKKNEAIENDNSQQDKRKKQIKTEEKSRKKIAIAADDDSKLEKKAKVTNKKRHGKRHRTVKKSRKQRKPIIKGRRSRVCKPVVNCRVKRPEIEYTVVQKTELCSKCFKKVCGED